MHISQDTHFTANDENTGDETRALPERAEIDSRYKWKLEDLYETDELWQQDAARLQAELPKLSAYAGKLGHSAADLLCALQLSDQIEQKASRLYAYAHMRADEDSRNSVYQALSEQALSLIVQVQSISAFLVPELLAIPADVLERFYTEEPVLQMYRFAIEQITRQKPHVLPANEELLLAYTEEMAGSPRNIFSMFNNADLTFDPIQDESGRILQVTHGRYLTLLESSSREVRRQAFESVYTAYEKYQNTLAATYQASVKKDVFYAKVRHYPSAREAALFPDNVPVAVYDRLIEAVHASIPTLSKYLRLRQSVLSLDKLHMYDLYTPLVADVESKISYEEAVETVLESLQPLGEEYVAVARKGILEDGWVDVYENRGKRSGAYSTGAYPAHPYILLNHTENRHGMFTLAHELGHAMHTYFSYQHQPHVYAHYTIFVAEVASTCNESLLFHHLLKKTSDNLQRAALINHHLETIRTTLVRQTLFAEFEMLAHAHVEEGGALTAEWLKQTYKKLIELYFGTVCHVDDQIAMEWARIPHFYNAFYVYKYATGLSAALDLSEQILKEKEPAVERYLQFLKSGGSDEPIALLQKAGVDMLSPEPVKKALQRFDTLVDELASTLNVAL